MTMTPAISHWLSNLSVILSTLYSHSLRQSVYPSSPSCSKGGNAIRIHLLKLYPVEIAAGLRYPTFEEPEQTFTVVHYQSASQFIPHFSISQPVSLFVSQTVTRYGAGHSLLKWSGGFGACRTWKCVLPSHFALCVASEAQERMWKLPSTWKFIRVYHPSPPFACSLVGFLALLFTPLWKRKTIISTV